MPQRPWAYERGILFATGSETARVSPRLAAVFKELGRDSAAQIADAMGMANTKAVLARFSSGRRCFGAWVGSRLVVYGWVSLTAECIGEQEREIRMPMHEAYIWNCETLPEYRGKRLYSALLCYIVTTLFQEGVRRVWIGTALSNRPSLRGFVNAGFRPVLTLIYTRFLSLHAVLEMGHPDASPALVAAARRAVTMEHEHAWGPLVVGASPPAQLPTCAEVEA